MAIFKRESAAIDFTTKRNIKEKIKLFLPKCGSLRKLDPNIFDNIDKYKEIDDLSYCDYYLEYIKSLPKLDKETAIRIAREVYQLFGREIDFDEILKYLNENNCINFGSLNKDDENCITKATESNVLLTGTYYDVILLCHVIGHKLRYGEYTPLPDIIDSLFFETPSIIMELAANDYLKDKYNVDISADEARKKQVLSIGRKNGVARTIFFIILDLLKKYELDDNNLYREIIKDESIVSYLSNPQTSIEDCVDQAMADYDYDIGYIMGNFASKNGNKTGILKMVLNYKDNGLIFEFTIGEDIIKEALGTNRMKW